MQRLAPLIFLGLLSATLAVGQAYGANPAESGPMRPRTGGQLYVQRVATLEAGELYSRILPSMFVDQWQTARQQPTHEQWQRLLAQEADMMALAQGQSALTVLVGDSLCLWLPQEHLSADRLWLNQSISGETTEHMVQRLTYFAAVRPDAIYVMAGVNDLKNGVDPQVVVSNLELIVQRLKMQHPRSRIVVLSILPTRLPTIPNELVGQVNRQLAAAMGRRGADFIDLQPAFRDSQGALRMDFTTDGLHLNPQGYSLLATYLTQP